MGIMERYHRPVLLREVIEYLNISPGGKYADLTFGEGGHSEAILEAGASEVVATDRDKEALETYAQGGKYALDPRLKRFHTRFSRFREIAGDTKFDGILVDLGVSTRQLLRAERGFSFSQAGPLDMRMDASHDEDLLSRLKEMTVEELTEALRENADLAQARSYARRIFDRLSSGRLNHTLDLAAVAGPKHGRSHPATPLFLALRMMVNNELGEVNDGIPPLLDCLRPGGRLVVITFHSTEDRAVKKLFQKLSGRCICGPHQAVCLCSREKLVELILRKPLTASAEELAENPRARSAKLRCVEKNAMSS